MDTVLTQLEWQYIADKAETLVPFHFPMWLLVIGIICSIGGAIWALLSLDDGGISSLGGPICMLVGIIIIGSFLILGPTEFIRNLRTLAYLEANHPRVEAYAEDLKNNSIYLHDRDTAIQEIEQWLKKRDLLQDPQMWNTLYPKKVAAAEEAISEAIGRDFSFSVISLDGLTLNLEGLDIKGDTNRR